MGVLAIAACALAAILLLSWERCPPPERILAVTVALVAAVFAALFAFVHPSGDDYSFAIALRGTDPWSALARFYQTWTGRFASVSALMAVTALHPLVWACRIAILLVLALETAAFAVIVHRLAAGALSASQAAWVAVAAMCIAAAAMPSAAEGMYWASAVMAYELGTALTLVAVAALLAPASRWTVAAAAIAAFLVAGCNEGSLALMAVVLAAGVVHRRLDTGRWDRAWLVVCGTFTVGAVIALAAPGNRARLAVVGHEPHVIGSALATVGFAVRLVARWSVEPVVVAAAAVVAAWSWRREPGRVRLRVLLPAWLLGVVAACAPACIALEMSPPRRVLDVAFTAFLIGLLACVRVAAPRARIALLAPGEGPGTALRLTAVVAAGAWLGISWFTPGSGEELLLLALLVAALLLAVYARSRRCDLIGTMRQRRVGIAALTLALTLAATGSTPQAVVDLLVHAPARSRELALREAWLEDRGASVRGLVRVPLPDPLHRPETIAFIDITSDAAGWINAAYAAYYGVPAITVDPRVATPTVMPAR
jgi:hypothetical protein